jgi:hypothetical protein
MLFPGYGPRILSVRLVSVPGRDPPRLRSRPGGRHIAERSELCPHGGSSTLAGWHSLGPAAWRADQGEIVGKGTDGSGWLVLDHSFQDTGLYASFQCTGTCDTGVLLRLQQTPEGMHVRHWCRI